MPQADKQDSCGANEVTIFVNKKHFCSFFDRKKKGENENWIISIFRQIKKLFSLAKKCIKNSLSNIKVEQLLNIYKNKGGQEPHKPIFGAAVNISCSHPI